MEPYSPGANSPEFDAGYDFVDKVKDSADGFHGFAPWWHGWMVRQAFWEGVKWERDRKVDEIIDDLKKQCQVS